QPHGRCFITGEPPTAEAGPSAGPMLPPNSLSCRPNMPPGSTLSLKPCATSVTGEALQAIADLDLDDLLAIGSPRIHGSYPAAKAAIAHYARYPAQDLGPFGITANCITLGVIPTGRIIATVIPGSSQSNCDRAEFIALRRLEMARIAPKRSSFSRL